MLSQNINENDMAQFQKVHIEIIAVYLVANGIDMCLMLMAHDHVIR